jgi:hypothetical protein
MGSRFVCLLVEVARSLLEGLLDDFCGLFLAWAAEVALDYAVFVT